MRFDLAQWYNPVHVPSTLNNPRDMDHETGSSVLRVLGVCEPF